MPPAFSPDSIPNRFDFAESQARIYREWEARGFFHAEPPPAGEPDPTKGPFCIVIPPPNVTGALHLGHALNNTLQDIQIRMRRMQGYNTLWMPGTDHAGIATQAVVERRLREEENKTRHDLGREKLVERIWQWKEQYEARILTQLKQMGCSCDWGRTRFTLDEGCSRAVRQTFFDLFRKGLIYRGKRLVNWDTFLQTAVSDDEVFHETVKGHFWHFRYPLAGVQSSQFKVQGSEQSDLESGTLNSELPAADEPAFVEIATTRPETMLGDTAVAVHPDPAAALDAAEAELQDRLEKAPAKEKEALQAQIDEIQRRRREMLPLLLKLRDMARAGRKLKLPLVNREIPLICDEWAKPDLGTGAVKITPAHDPNDYEVWQRHQEIGAINILNPDGTLNENAGPYTGLTIYKAREKVVADLDALGLLGEVEDREIDLAHSDRSKTPIEPYLADQWFVKMSDYPDGRPGLAQMAMDAVQGGPLQSGPLAPRVGIPAARAAENAPSAQCTHGNSRSELPTLGGGRVKIVPERYAKSYLDWLSEKRDWPVSRQLWWGHRIPVWTAHVTGGTQALEDSRQFVRGHFEKHCVPSNEYCLDAPDGTTIRVCPGSDRAEAALRQLCSLSPTPCPLLQDSDVLDTWFSSALWPHSTLGWPEQTDALKYWYPTSVLITSRDIITLWVARMVLTGLNNVGEIPFRQVFIHPKILDGYGETMSKSKGNGVDPIDIIDKFGADSLRFGLAALTTETQDVRMPVQFECPHCQALLDQTKKNRELPRIACPKCGQEFSTQWAKSEADKALPRAAVVSERFEVARNFMNKLWNAARFVLINLAEQGSGNEVQSSKFKVQGAASGNLEPGTLNLELTIEDRWLLSRLATVTKSVTAAFESYRYADAAKILYDFAWDEFCSFYVEIAKARLADPQSRPTAQRVLAHALDTILRLLHPIMPFITEEIWQLLNQVAPARGLPLGEGSGFRVQGSGFRDEESGVSSQARGDRGKETGDRGTHRSFDQPPLTTHHSPLTTHHPPATTPHSPAPWLIRAPWPEPDLRWQDPETEARFAVFQQALGAIREIRSRQNIAPRQPIEFAIRCEPAAAALLSPMAAYFQSMTNATATGFGPQVAIPPTHAKSALPGMEIYVDLKDFIDVQAELAKNEREEQRLLGLIKGKEAKLANESFVSRAPANVVQAERDGLAQLQQQLASVRAALASLRNG